MKYSTLEIQRLYNYNLKMRTFSHFAVGIHEAYYYAVSVETIGSSAPSVDSIASRLAFELPTTLHIRPPLTVQNLLARDMEYKCVFSPNYFFCCISLFSCAMVLFIIIIFDLTCVFDYFAISECNNKQTAAANFAVDRSLKARKKGLNIVYFLPICVSSSSIASLSDSQFQSTPPTFGCFVSLHGIDTRDTVNVIIAIKIDGYGWSSWCNLNSSAKRVQVIELPHIHSPRALKLHVDLEGSLSSHMSTFIILSPSFM
jgi:hypothetical protein